MCSNTSSGTGEELACDNYLPPPDTYALPHEYCAYELTRWCPPDSDDRLASALVDAQVDPVSEEVWIQHLRTREREVQSVGEGGGRAPRAW